MSAPFASYSDFASAVLDPIEAHRREHLVEHWEDSAAAVKSLLDGLSGPSLCSSDVVTTVTGWLDPLSGSRLRPRKLEALNPGYVVRVNRHPRRELGRIAQLLRAGFTVTARWTGAGTPDPFTFAVHRDGLPFDLPASNADAAHRKTFFPVPLRNDATGPPRGYVDLIQTIPMGADGQPETWLAELVHAHPKPCLDLIDSIEGASIGPEVARLAQAFPENSRWSDKFTQAAHGLDGVYHSDLLHLRVRTLNPTPPVGPTSFLLPEPTADGPVVRFSRKEKRIPAPSTEWLKIDDAVVEDGGTVRAGDALIVYEASANPASDFVSGQFTSVFGSKLHPDSALIQPRPDSGQVIPEGILLAGRNDFNWFHWLVEYLPRVLQADGVVDPEIPVLITDFTPSTGLQALNMLSSRPVIELDREFSQRVSRLHVVAPPVQVLDTTGLPWSEGLSLNEPVLQQLRDAWGVGESAKATRRVFLQRNSRHRGLINEDHLAEIARDSGLEVVDPGELDFAMQLELFSTSKLLVGASGAVMANYLMMAPGSRIVAMTSEALFDFVLPAALAAVAGAEFTYLTGPPTRTLEEAPDRNQWLIQSDFEVDPAAFRRLLTSELAAL